MTEASVLFVEGRRAGNESLVSALIKEGLQVQVVHTGSEALDLIQEKEPDLVVFDSSSMRSSGIRSIRRLRRLLPHTPIIHCQSLIQSEDRLTGADVYLVRPFTARKLVNRIKALLPADDLKVEIVRAGHLTFYPSKRSVDVAGRGERRLTPKLASLLEEFLRHPEEVLSRNQLMQTVWHTSYFGDTRTLDVHIRWVREIIEANPARPSMLKTVRGVGYIFSLPPDKK